MLRSATLSRKISLFYGSDLGVLARVKWEFCRNASCSSREKTSNGSPHPWKKKVNVHVKVGGESSNREHVFEAPLGVTLLTAIRDVGQLEIEAACDGTCACSTCHVILSPDSYAAVLEANKVVNNSEGNEGGVSGSGEISEEEMDMLDLAPSLCATSRLACQVPLTERLEGKDIYLRIPEDS